MEKKYGIALFYVMVMLIISLSLGYRISYEHMEEQLMSVQGTAKQGDIFVLKNLNGYLVVFREDGTTIYEYTDIRIQELPASIQKEMNQGKRIVGIEKLYGFLENFTS